MEGVVFFIMEGMYLPLVWLPSCFFMAAFGWLYAAEMVWVMVDIFIFILAGGEALYEMDAEVYYNGDDGIKNNKENTISMIVDATFEEYDKNGDGFLNKEESKDFAETVFTKLYKEHGMSDKETFSDDVYNDLWAKYDKNKDDKLDKEEMTPFIYSLLKKGFAKTDESATKDKKE